MALSTYGKACAVKHWNEDNEAMTAFVIVCEDPGGTPFAFRCGVALTVAAVFLRSPCLGGGCYRRLARPFRALKRHT